MGPPDEGRKMDDRGGDEGKNDTFGGLGFDVCNPNTCLGGDTLTVIDTKVLKDLALLLSSFSKSPLGSS